MCQLFLFHKDRIFSRLYRIFCQQFIFRWQPIERLIFATPMAGLHGGEGVQPSHDFEAAPQGAARPRGNGYITTLVTRLVPSV